MADRWTRAIDEKIAVAARAKSLATRPDTASERRLRELLDPPWPFEDALAFDYSEVSDLFYQATPYWVAPDLSDLVGVAFASVPDDFALAPHHFPTQSGYVLFEHELQPDYEGWFTDSAYTSTVGPDGRLSLDLDASDYLDEENETRRRAIQRRRLTKRNTTDLQRVQALYWKQDGRSVRCGLFWRRPIFAAGEQPVTDFDLLRAAILTHARFDFGTTLAEIASSPENVYYLAAFLLLAGERLTVTTYERPAREQRRRAAKANEPPPPDIRVVKLRAVDRHKGDSTGDLGEYDYRWLVRGHWHRYWVGPVGEQRLEPKWVSPYVKGPDDKPLRVHTGELYAVVR